MTIAEARAAYVGLRERAALLVRDPRDTAYVYRLWSLWDEKLAEYQPETPLPSWIDHTTKVIADPKLDSDSVMCWLDAYPDGVVERLPGGVFPA